MTGCPRTDAIEARLARGEELSASAAEHAAACAECAGAVSAAAGLDADLPRVVSRMVTEPIPPAAALIAAGEGRRWWTVGALVRVATVAAAAALLVVAILVGRFVGIGDRAPGAGGGPQSTASAVVDETGAVPPDMAEWAAAADRSIWAHMDRPLPAPDLTLVRLERCGDTGLAFYADPAPSDAAYPLLFGIGNYRNREPLGEWEAGFGGVASSVDEPEAAYARSQGAPCEVVFDTTVSREDALAAYVTFLGNDPRVRDPRVLATKMVTVDVALAYLDEVRVADGQPHQQVVWLRHDGGAWAVMGAQGGELPVVGSAVGVTPLGVSPDLPDVRSAAVVRVDDPSVVAVEIDFDGFAHSYPIAGGALVIQLPADVGVGLPYRLIDAEGGVVSEGTSQP